MDPPRHFSVSVRIARRLSVGRDRGSPQPGPQCGLISRRSLLRRYWHFCFTIAGPDAS